MNDTICIEWAQRVNATWICHQGLDKCAREWMDHLESTCPERLARSCRNAFRMTMKAGPGNDPKPWFYAGLFSLASTDEKLRWLANHPFTAAAVESCAHPGGETVPWEERISGPLLGQIRGELAGLVAPDRKSSPGDFPDSPCDELLTVVTPAR